MQGEAICVLLRLCEGRPDGTLRRLLADALGDGRADVNGLRYVLRAPLREA